MKRTFYTFFLFFAVVASTLTRDSEAQSAPAAFKEPFTLDLGGTVSVFDPDYVPNKLVGVGGYLDLNVFHGVGVEAEGRWQRWHTYEDITQDNYLIGPRIKIKHFWKTQPYVKVLGGFTHMNFEYGYATGRFTTIAMGGGVDIHLSRRWSVRAADFEYQEWPTFLSSSLSPYGVSSGISYRIFSR